MKLYTYGLLRDSFRTWGGSGESQDPEPSARRCANVDGFSVHANVSLPANQRTKLENLCQWRSQHIAAQIFQSAYKVGKSVPLYVETSTGCRASGASSRRPPRVSNENTLARRHNARDH